MGSQASYCKQEKEEEYQKLQNFNIVLIGDSVGKTSILNQYSDQDFTLSIFKTSNEQDFRKKQIILQNSTFELIVWDTCSAKFKNQQNFEKYHNDFIGAILVYDITNKGSFQNIQKYYQQLMIKNSKKYFIIMVVGNKQDLQKQRAVPYEQGEKWAKDNQLYFFETSAKNDTNIQLVFENFATLISQHYNIKCKINQSKNNSFVQKEKNNQVEKKINEVEEIQQKQIQQEVKQSQIETQTMQTAETMVQIEDTKITEIQAKIKELEKQQFQLQQKQLQEQNNLEQQIDYYKQQINEQILPNSNSKNNIIKKIINNNQNSDNYNINNDEGLVGTNKKQQIINEDTNDNDNNYQNITINNQKNQIYKNQINIQKEYDSQTNQMLQSWNNMKQQYEVQYDDLQNYYNDYEQGEKISSGTYGEVYKLKNKKPEQQKKLAVKILKYSEDEYSKQTQEIEVKTLQTIKMLPQEQRQYVLTPINVYHDQEKETINIVMPLAKKSFYDEIKERKRNMDFFQENQIISLTIQALLGLSTLEYLSISNRDIKLQNLLLMDDNTLKIADFGTSKKMKHNNQEHTLLIGTPKYWAPEIIEEYINQISSQIDEEQKKQQDFSKSELFSVGQCMLQAASLQWIRNIDQQNLKKKQLQVYLTERNQQHQQLLVELQTRYSNKFIQILEKMLNPDFENRISLPESIQQLFQLQALSQ